MKKKRFILTLLMLAFLFSPTINAQFIQSEWINISNQTGDDMWPDIFKAKDGSLHCVWTKKHSNDYMEIYYSKSTDNGETWSLPENITKQDTFVFLMPHIVVDTQNNIFVTADSSLYSAGIVLITSDGNSWSNYTYLHSNWGRNNKLYIDNNDRVYAFWQGNVQYFYKYFENNTWSETFEPFTAPDTVLFMNGSIDKLNNLHFIGFYNNKPAYYKYNVLSDTWQTPYIFSEYFSYGDQDITTDDNNFPSVVFRVRTNTQPPYHDGTVFYSSNGISFSTPELVVEDPVRQKIIWFNNQIYIIDKEKYDDNYKIVIYKKDNNNNWWGTIVSYITPFCTIYNVIIIDNQLSILYAGEFDGIQDDIYLQKLNIHESSVFNPPESPLILYQNYPNPVKDRTVFKYSINTRGKCRLSILDLHGRTLAVPINKEQTPGTYEFHWNTRDASGNRLPAGTYYYRLIVDNIYTMTKSFVINK